jgi:hypothetical protein
MLNTQMAKQSGSEFTALEARRTHFTASITQLDGYMLFLKQ